MLGGRTRAGGSLLVAIRFLTVGMRAQWGGSELLHRLFTIPALHPDCK